MKRESMPRCPNPRCQADYPPDTIQCTNPFCQCLLPEAIIAGRYRIETLIGMGGMGSVYRVSDTFETMQVALKTLSLASNPDRATAVERFRREARYAHQLHHENIVSVLNFGQDGALLYLVMPLITGGTLRNLLKNEHILPLAQTRRYLNDLAKAIDAIHKHPQQIVHRDIKPSNLLIHQDDGRLVVTDFGISRAMQHEKPLTQRGMALGTEHYTAPEQEQGKAQPASDIYAMGVVVYQMLTGLLPYQALVKSRGIAIPGPSTLNASLPLAIDEIVLKAMALDPAHRYHSAGAFADALNAAFDSADEIAAMPTIAETIIANSMANVVIRTVIPESPCGLCGHENRSGSHFCRACGNTLDETSPLVTDMCQIGYLSDRGKQGGENEDMLLVVQGLCTNLMPPPRPFSLFAVADGLRSSQDKATRGHEASRLAVETIADVLVPLLNAPSHSYSRVTPHHNAMSNPASPISANKHARLAIPPDSILERWLGDSTRQANQVIYHCNADYETQMASTLTAALLYKHHLYVTSVGDSRAYHYSSRHGLRRISNDHTLAAQLVEAKLLQPEEVYTSAKRNQLYRTLGKAYTVPIDTFHLEVEPDELILLCTDGLWHMLRDERITQLLTQSSDPQQQAKLLVEAANHAGGEGNISAIVAHVQ